ncbi:MAG: hypothetical protein GXO91_06335 [FCB group bacterium]|nr:hypothetical protein [FCB group bacterium]
MSLDLTSVTEMEDYFADHGDTPLFPVLAELYYKQKDFEHARGVCEIGLDKHPDSADGAFILSKIELVDKNLPESEKLLKIVVNGNPVHIFALRLLMQVQIALDRSSNTVQKTVEHLLRIYPDDEECLKWLAEHKNRPAEPEPEQTETPKLPAEAQPASTENYIKVNSRMATFTLAEVFIKQGNFLQAREILNLIEEKGGNTDRIAKERKRITKLMAEQESADE